MKIEEKIIRDVMQEVADKYLKARFIEMGKNASGDWLNSVEVRVFGNTGQIWALDYSKYIQSGRSEGVPPPIAPLIRWVEYKFGADNIGMAYAIQHKISNEGTETYQDGGNDLISHLGSDEVINFVKEQMRIQGNKVLRMELLHKASKIFK